MRIANNYQLIKKNGLIKSTIRSSRNDLRTLFTQIITITYIIRDRVC